MKHFKKSTVACLVAACTALVGCSTVEPTIVTKEVEVILVPPAQLMRPTRVIAPPEVDYFLSLTDDDAFDLMMEFASGQTTQLHLCNKDKESLRKWVDEQQKVSTQSVGQ